MLIVSMNYFFAGVVAVIRAIVILELRMPRAVVINRDFELAPRLITGGD